MHIQDGQATPVKTCHSHVGLQTRQTDELAARMITVVVEVNKVMCIFYQIQKYILLQRSFHGCSFLWGWCYVCVCVCVCVSGVREGDILSCILKVTKQTPCEI